MYTEVLRAKDHYSKLWFIEIYRERGYEKEKLIVMRVDEVKGNEIHTEKEVSKYRVHIELWETRMKNKEVYMTNKWQKCIFQISRS